MVTLNNYHRFGRRKCSKSHRFVPFWKCSVRIRSMMLGSTDSRKRTLISREIIFKEFQPIWLTNHQRYRRTDRQTDGRYAIPRVHCAVKTAEPVIEILSLSDRPVILIFCHQELLHKSDCFTPNRGAEYKRVAIVAKKRGYILLYWSCVASRGLSANHSSSWWRNAVISTHATGHRSLSSWQHCRHAKVRRWNK